MKNPLTPAGIEPATFPIVAQHLNHLNTLLGYNSNVALWVSHIVIFRRVILENIIASLYTSQSNVDILQNKREKFRGVAHAQRKQ